LEEGGDDGGAEPSEEALRACPHARADKDGESMRGEPPDSAIKRLHRSLQALMAEGADQFGGKIKYRRHCEEQAREILRIIASQRRANAQDIVRFLEWADRDYSRKTERDIPWRFGQTFTHDLDAVGAGRPR